MSGRHVVSCALILMLWLAGAAHAGIEIRAMPGDFTSALFATSPPNDASRIFVVEQNGEVHITSESEGMLPGLFLDLFGIVRYDRQELGLLGFAFHPDYATNGHFFVYYTRTVNGRIQSVVSRFTAQGDPATSVVADPNSEQIKLVVDQPFDNHNGGMMAFGPDGYLYIAFGDGGAAYDPGNRSQDLNTYIGKLLRVDADGEGPFTAPPDNPYVGDTPGLDLIWASGLRNPWRFSFDRQTGDLWLADVGQQDFEEINFQPAGSPGGQNYGWRAYEGNNCNLPSECAPIADSVTFPIQTFAQTDAGLATTGGYVYRGSALPDFQGAYFFADYVQSTIGFLRYQPGGEPEVEVTDLTRILNPGGFICCLTSFGEDADGELYLVSQFKVYKIIDDGVTYLDLEPFAQMEQPVQVAGPDGEAGRQFIIQRTGYVRVVDDGALLETPVLDITGRMDFDDNLGLLGIAFHPDFDSNGYFFLHYTRRNETDPAIVESVISRFTMTGSPADATVADPDSELILLVIPKLIGNHNGGSIAFSPNDGYLWIPMGDGGCCNDPNQTAQDLTDLSGKLLRIDVDNQDPGLNYAIPPDNPFAGDDGVRDEIWAYGLRNPFRSSFDRETGDLYIGDVGQDFIEEIILQPASSTGGENHGWPTFEGSRCNVEITTQDACDALEPNAAFPIFDYTRQFGASVTGGSVYRGSAIPGLNGRYLYADYVYGRVFSFVADNGVATAAREYTEDLNADDLLPEGIVAISEDGAGELYLVSIFGEVFKIVQGLGDDSANFDPPDEEGEGLPDEGLELRLQPTADASLYESATGNFANGAGPYIFSGRTGDNAGFANRRALLQFDIAGALPPDAEIISASLRLRCSKTPVGGSATVMSLHPVTRAWNEGPTATPGAGGAGSLAQTGDVTWLHTYFNASFWDTPGGDFLSAPSATRIVDDTGFYVWSDDQLATDVAGWLENPDANFGWMLIGDEVGEKTARRFDSRENATEQNRPELIIHYCGAPQDGWLYNPANGHYYYALDPLPWSEALALATCTGGYLATVNDAEENQWIQDNLAALYGDGYIGYNDVAEEGVFAWSNGETPGYANWAGGEPNDLGGEDATLLAASNGQWFDVAVSAEHPGYVERETRPFFRHSADYTRDGSLSLSELLRTIQLYNNGALHCADEPASTEDGYLPGAGLNQTCAPHAADYAPQDWSLNLAELLRVIQLYNAGLITRCDEGEDGFCFPE
ncbi:MAG: hypothetical protein RLZZ303_2443 [Candidatus Hydrogenedentota bacterium]